MSPTPKPDAVESLGVLADPARRRLYDYVVAQGRPVRRDDAAAAVGISRTLAAYHLDRLAEASLLATSYARPPGQGGPGAGRPAKHYQRASGEVAVSVPPRRYDLLAQVLADAVAADDTGTVTSALMSAAEQEGRTAGTGSGDLMAMLTEHGYEPLAVASGDIVLRNCPFHQMSRRQTELVCGLNHALLRGALAGCGQDPGRAELAPCPGHCCVVIRPPTH